MKKPLFVITTLLALFTQPGLADGMSEGKTLHDAKCLNCHMMGDHTVLYTRKDRKVDSLKKLGGFVSSCVQNLNIDWFPEEEKKVRDYINATWYKFPAK
jgi:hypothetical protein